MPLDLFAEDLRLRMDHSEEYLLEFASQNPDDYPELAKMWAAFYDDPKIDLEQSGRIVHELIELHSNMDEAGQTLRHSILRFMLFFSKVYRRSIGIQCSSD
ncbi:MAG: hypothetical protein AAFQ10_12520 [Pseudomonadota bacterium]